MNAAIFDDHIVITGAERPSRLARRILEAVVCRVEVSLLTRQLIVRHRRRTVDREQLIRLRAEIDPILASE